VLPIRPDKNLTHRTVARISSEHYRATVRSPLSMNGEGFRSLCGKVFLSSTFLERQE
jgi:hypothetical protein